MLDLPDSPLTPFVLRNCARLGSKPALVDAATGEAITYAELPAEIDAAAGALARAGHAPGDVVGVVLPNMPEFAVVFHAAVQRGGVVTPVNPALTSAEIGRQLGDARARYVVTSPDLAPAVSEASGGARLLLVGTPDLRGPAFVPEPSAPGDLAALPFRAGRPDFRRGSCSRTATWPRTSSRWRASSAAAPTTCSWPSCRISTSTASRST